MRKRKLVDRCPKCDRSIKQIRRTAENRLEESRSSGYIFHRDMCDYPCEEGCWLNILKYHFFVLMGRFPTPEEVKLYESKPLPSER